MNKKQVALMWLGVLAILIGSAFPYWYLSSATWTFAGGGYGYSFNKPLGRHFIFAPPEVDGGAVETAWIDLAPLHIEWTVISVVAIGLIVTFRDKEK